MMLLGIDIWILLSLICGNVNDSLSVKMMMTMALGNEPFQYIVCFEVGGIGRRRNRKVKVLRVSYF